MIVLKPEQKLSETPDLELTLAEAGVIHYASVKAQIMRDAARNEEWARRQNRTTCIARMNSYLNARGIYQTRPETWPKRPTKLALFKPEEKDDG